VSADVHIKSPIKSRVCRFTHVADIFEDELGIDFKEYPKAVKNSIKKIINH
jgi:hypothetical protein